MPLFRKKPVVIEAMQLTRESFSEVGDWADDSVIGWQGPAYESPVYFDIGTLEGTMRANEGDWIIKGVNGEFYPCKPDIFAKTYEAVESPALT